MSDRPKVSPIDSWLLKQYRWRKNNYGYWVRDTSVRIPGRPLPVGRTIPLSREIMGLEYGNPLQVDHVDEDIDNNCRDNLEIVTKEENLRRRYGRR